MRLFAGYNFTKELLSQDNLITEAYLNGVSMGSELAAEAGKTPTFVAQAIQDPDAAPLQRLQIIKGWTINGEHHEKVFDVACSDGLSVDPNTHRCPDNGAQVDLGNCEISSNVGAATLQSVWRDPEFDPEHRAFYYVRVLENPTCRWSTWDAIRAGVAPRQDLATTIQERAWSSAIWYVP